MKRSGRLGAGILFLAIMATLSVAQQSNKPTILGFSVPNYNDQMEMVNRIRGDEAELVGDGKAVIRNLIFELFKNGEVDMVVTSPSCTYNESINQGESSSSIRIERDNLLVTGEDYVFNGGSERIEIERNARVVLKRTKVRLFGDTP